MQHVAIADDRPQSIQKVLNCLKFSGKFTVDFVAGNGYELLEQLHQADTLPNVIITDINMPVMDGIASNFFLSRQYPQVKIVSLSIYLDHYYIQQVIDSGAHGYLVKPDAETVILTALENVLSGNRYIDARTNVNTGLNNHYSFSGMHATETIQFNLTPRELVFVMLNATPLSYTQIAKLMFVEQKTVHTYYDRVAHKLNVNSRQALTLFSLQNGLARIARYS